MESVRQSTLPHARPVRDALVADARIAVELIARFRVDEARGSTLGPLARHDDLLGLLLYVLTKILAKIDERIFERITSPHLAHVGYPIQVYPGRLPISTRYHHPLSHHQVLE